MATLITVDGESSEVQATELAEMQALVGGYIETVTFPDGSLMICNEGKEQRAAAQQRGDGDLQDEAARNAGLDRRRCDLLLAGRERKDAGGVR